MANQNCSRSTQEAVLQSTPWKATDKAVLVMYRQAWNLITRVRMSWKPWQRCMILTSKGILLRDSGFLKSFGALHANICAADFDPAAQLIASPGWLIQMPLKHLLAAIDHISCLIMSLRARRAARYHRHSSLVCEESSDIL